MDKAVDETLESVPVELMALDEVALVEGELTPDIALVEVEVAGRDVITEGVPVVFDKTDDVEGILDAIGMEKFETGWLVKELAKPDGIPGIPGI